MVNINMFKFYGDIERLLTYFDGMSHDSITYNIFMCNDILLYAIPLKI